MLRPRTVLLATALLVATAILLGWLWWRDAPATVDIVRPRRGSAVELIYATGFVEPDHPVTVASRLTAPVTRILVDEGDPVRRGQALLLLDDQDLQAALAQAQAQSAGAGATEQRVTALFGQGWVTRAARDDAQAMARAARAATGAARARVDQATLRAGIDGIVTKRDVEAGDLAAPGRTLMILGDPTQVRVTATVDERDITHVRVGQLAWLSSDAWPGRRLRAHVRAITPSGDPDQRAFRTRLSVDSQQSLPLGMTFEVNIVTQQHEGALLVPASALVQSRIWVEEGGRASPRSVRLGIVGPRQVEILAGLAPTEAVIDHPPATLRSGQRIRGRR